MLRLSYKVLSLSKYLLVLVFLSSCMEVAQVPTEDSAIEGEEAPSTDLEAEDEEVEEEIEEDEEEIEETEEDDSQENASSELNIPNKFKTLRTNYFGKVCPPPAVEYDLATTNFPISLYDYDILDSSNAGGDVSLSNGVLTYTPEYDYTGVARISYKVTHKIDTHKTGTSELTINQIGEPTETQNTQKSFDTSFATMIPYDASDSNAFEKGYTEFEPVYNPVENKWYAAIVFKHNNSTAHADCTGKPPFLVGYATSDDGENWDVSEDIILDASKDYTNPDNGNRGCYFVKAHLLFDGEKYHLLGKVFEEDSTFQLTYYTSDNFTDWDFQQNIDITDVDADNQIHDGSFIKVDDTMIVTWLSTDLTKTHYIRSTDNGVSWHGHTASDKGSVLFRMTDNAISDLTVSNVNASNHSFTPDKFSKTNFFCNNDPNEKKIYAGITVKDSSPAVNDDGNTLNFNYAIFSNDGEASLIDHTEWNLASGVLDPVFLDSNEYNQWFTKSRILRYGKGLLMFWSNSDPDITSKKAVFKASTLGSTWPEFD